MKKAVVEAGGKQYIVSEGEIFSVELLPSEDKTISFIPLLLIDDEKIDVGKPLLDSHSVKAEIIAADIQDAKVTAIRFKAKKRVHKVQGHRQHKTQLKIVSID